jgi:K+-transporting ATPase ATPase B chain
MTKNTSLFQKDLMLEAFKQSFVKLNPKIMFRNPVMFTVEIGTAVMFVVCLWILFGEQSQGSFAYNFIVFLFYYSLCFLPTLQKP